MSRGTDKKRVKKTIRYDNLWEQVVNFENMYAAYLEASRGRRYKNEIMGVGKRVEAVIYQMIFELNTGTWQPQTYYEFECRTEVKRRIINAPTFRDRIFHHSLDRIVRPLFEKKYIYDSYACILGKGAHAAVQRVKKFLRIARHSGNVYILQCDIHHYYQSIDHEILKREISRTIKDKRLLEAWGLVIDRFNEDTGKGIPIGALTSQLAANIYLNPFDHFIKECMRAHFYVRYMDDFVIISNDKKELRKNLADIRWFLETQLKLELNPKTRIYQASQGVDFCGYRTWSTHILPRKRNIKAAKKRFQRLSRKFRRGEIRVEDARQSVASFLGYCKHCNAYATVQATLNRLVLTKAPKKEEEKQHGKNSTHHDDHGKSD